MSTINILLFGETGVGKSTTINAIANYIYFRSFEEAKSGKFVNKIPSFIILTDPITGKQMLIKDKNIDPNEHLNDQGLSVTQGPKNYDFEFDNHHLRFIDTPGLTDTGGKDTDKENLRKVVKHLEDFETLHAVCFLINAVTTRKTAKFRYVLNELMLNLPRTAVKNVVFCFTNSRNSMYGPGEGYETLKDTLSENVLNGERVNLEIGGNCFFVDNEAFRFLLALKHNYPFPDDHERSYVQSWDRSVEQTTQMINQIARLKPFKVNEMTTMFHTRRVVPLLVENVLKKLEEKTQELGAKIENKRLSMNELSQWQESIVEYEKERVAVREYICKLMRFLICTSNTNVVTLLGDYLSLFEQEKHERLYRGSGLARINSNSSLTIKVKQEIANQVKVEPHKVSVEELKQTQSKCQSELEHYGKEFADILEIEYKPVPKRPKSNSHTRLPGSAKLNGESSQIRQPLASITNQVANEPNFQTPRSSASSIYFTPPIPTFNISEPRNTQSLADVSNFNGENQQNLNYAPEYNSQSLASPFVETNFQSEANSEFAHSFPPTNVPQFPNPRNQFSSSRSSLEKSDHLQNRANYFGSNSSVSKSNVSSSEIQSPRIQNQESPITSQPKPITVNIVTKTISPRNSYSQQENSSNSTNPLPSTSGVNLDAQQVSHIANQLILVQNNVSQNEPSKPKPTVEPQEQNNPQRAKASNQQVAQKNQKKEIPPETIADAVANILNILGENSDFLKQPDLIYRMESKLRPLTYLKINIMHSSEVEQQSDSYTILIRRDQLVTSQPQAQPRSNNSWCDSFLNCSCF